MRGRGGRGIAIKRDITGALWGTYLTVDGMLTPPRLGGQPQPLSSGLPEYAWKVDDVLSSRLLPYFTEANFGAAGAFDLWDAQTVFPEFPIPWNLGSGDNAPDDVAVDYRMRRRYMEKYLWSDGEVRNAGRMRACQLFSSQAGIGGDLASGEDVFVYDWETRPESMTLTVHVEFRLESDDSLLISVAGMSTFDGLGDPAFPPCDHVTWDDDVVRPDSGSEIYVRAKGGVGSTAYPGAWTEIGRFLLDDDLENSEVGEWSNTITVNWADSFANLHAGTFQTYDRSDPIGLFDMTSELFTCGRWLTYQPAEGQAWLQWSAEIEDDSGWATRSGPLNCTASYDSTVYIPNEWATYRMRITGNDGDGNYAPWSEWSDWAEWPGLDYWNPGEDGGLGNGTPPPRVDGLAAQPGPTDGTVIWTWVIGSNNWSWELQYTSNEVDWNPAEPIDHVVPIAYQQGEDGWGTVVHLRTPGADDDDMVRVRAVAANGDVGEWCDPVHYTPEGWEETIRLQADSDKMVSPGYVDPGVVKPNGATTKTPVRPKAEPKPKAKPKAKAKAKAKAKPKAK